MISIIDSGKLVNTEVSPMVPRSCEMVGLSTDTKPTGVSVGNGWSFIEMDTGKVFFYNAADEEWLEFAGSGGGGGQGGSNVLVVNIVDNDSALDKTWKEIFEAPYSVFVVADSVSKVFYQCFSVEHVESTYAVEIVQTGDSSDNMLIFVTDSENGYPEAQV